MGAPPAPARAKDTLLFNANILTSEGAPPASAVLFHDGRIARVGDSHTLLSEASAGTQRIDLAGRCVVPGFSDAHAHIWKIGHLLTTLLDLRRTVSIPDLMESVRARDRQLPQGRWLLGRGFNEIAMVEKRKPTRYDLDQASPQRPVALTRTCGHICAVNSAAMRLAGIDAQTQAPAGGVIERDEHGEPNGILHETAIGLISRVVPPPTRCRLRRDGYRGAEASTLAGHHGVFRLRRDAGVARRYTCDMDCRDALPARFW